ncbi:LCP family protein [Anaerosacchariphilus polymeriproducens]|uniref:LytR family transcriptional regulator n=1 Tax=Anaerosacchariphilus polymeriproducens TaxID=1812858 RepID=A0A371ARC1_9FIRM|nr:LCP family protein [Anaerosacchariphilus polymeriproducens]RDU21990.1 LytR family transcriptional regulator [Anaerosacchariphilus polymeriproducens]
MRRFIVIILQFILTLVFLGSVIKLNLLPNKYIITLSLVWLAILAVTFFTQLSGRWVKTGKVISLIACVISVMGAGYFLKVQSILPSPCSGGCEVNAPGVLTKETKITKAVLNEEKKNISKEAFIIYISGLESYDEITPESQSDINIIAVVNPLTRQILLTTTPNDYYLKVPVIKSKKPHVVNDKMDQAATYGFESSIKAIQSLYDVQINYYVRVNHTTLMELVDALHGIQVNSKLAFKVGDYEFVKGNNKLDGKETVMFMQGDKDSRINDLLILNAINEKVSSPSIIKNGFSVMECISENVQTNFSKSELVELAKLKMTFGKQWKTIINSVNGTMKMEITNSKNSKEEVRVPDKKSLEDAKVDIQKVLGNEVLTR